MTAAGYRIVKPHTPNQHAHTRKIHQAYLLSAHHRIGNVTHVTARSSWWTNISREDFHTRAVK